MDLKSFMGKYDYISARTVRELGERRWKKFQEKFHRVYGSIGSSARFKHTIGECVVVGPGKNLEWRPIGVFREHTIFGKEIVEEQVLEFIGEHQKKARFNLTDTVQLKITYGELIRVYALTGKATGLPRDTNGARSVFVQAADILDPDGEVYKSFSEELNMPYWVIQEKFEEALMWRESAEEVAARKEIEELRKEIEEKNQRIRQLERITG